LRRLAALLLLSAAALPAPPAPAPHPYVQAVEFPYYLCPRPLWERELVWLKNIGVETVEFSIPWNWHQLQPGDYDFTGRTSPRRDLVGFIRILRKLDLHAWVRPLPPVNGFLANGAPAGADARAQRAWLRRLEQLLSPQTVSHGGPIAYVEGRALAIDAAAPPASVTTISAVDPDALARSREAIANTSPNAVLWTHVEDALYPAGWAADPTTLLRPGAVGLSGDERPAAVALRRTAALLRNWGPLHSAMRAIAMPKPAAGKLPDGVTANELVSAAASAISITNRGKLPFHDDVRVFEPLSKRTLIVPGVNVPPGESLWLPLNVSLGPMGPCHECTQFSEAEHIVYATAELLSIEFENGILAMEFAAPVEGEMILQLARKPVGPFLASGKPTEFEWDDKALRARFAIPANAAAGNRVRVGIAMEAPETSAFFNEARRLIIGQKNVVSTAYSSAEVAARSRMRLPEGFTAVPTAKSPNEIDYEIGTPTEALHGDFADLALEADGVPLGRAHRTADGSHPDSLRHGDGTDARSAHRAGGTEGRQRSGTLHPEQLAGNSELCAGGLGRGAGDLPRQAGSCGGSDGRAARASAHLCQRRRERRRGGRARMALAGNRRRGAGPAHARPAAASQSDGGLVGGPGRRRFFGVGPGNAESACDFLLAGWRAVDGIQLEGHQPQFSTGTGCVRGGGSGGGSRRGR